MAPTGYRSIWRPTMRDLHHKGAWGHVALMRMRALGPISPCGKPKELSRVHVDECSPYVGRGALGTQHQLVELRKPRCGDDGAKVVVGEVGELDRQQ